MPFPSCRHHATFVSGQILPSLLAAAVPGAQPGYIHAIVTPQMKDHASILKKALEAHGRKFRAYQLANTRRQSVYDVLDAIHAACKKESLGLNLTCGTKLMTLAAAEWANIRGVPTFYVDTGEDVLVLPGREWEYLDMPSVLDIEDLLTAGGYTITDCTRDAVPGERRDILREMLKLLCAAPEAKQALQSLNALSAEAGRRRDMLVQDTATPTSTWQQLLDLCQRADMLHYDSGYIGFPSEDARRWCNGIWLEEYVRMVLYTMRASKRIADWASSVNVSSDNTRNELDALFCVRNRLFVIECKTSAMTTGQQSGDLNKVTAMLYKADSLHDKLGGIYTRTALCTVLPLEKSAMDRARKMKIHVVSGSELLQLDNNLARWASQS